MQSGARVREEFDARVRAAALALLASLLALPATAGTLTIDFDFASGSSLEILGGIINTPPDGSISAGAGTITVEASNATTPTVGGSAQLSGSTLGGFVIKDLLPNAFVAGGFDITQTAPANGTLSAADTITFSDSFAVDLTANFSCSGPDCSLLGLPVNVAGPFLFPLQPLPVVDLDSPGLASIVFDVPVSLDGVQAVFHLVGVETGRSFIPEPGTAALLGLLLWMPTTAPSLFR